jgi:hypothetical protein
MNGWLSYNVWLRGLCAGLSCLYEITGPVRQAADGNIIRRMRFACLITKVKGKGKVHPTTGHEGPEGVVTLFI